MADDEGCQNAKLNLMLTEVSIERTARALLESARREITPLRKAHEDDWFRAQTQANRVANAPPISERDERLPVDIENATSHTSSLA